MVAIFETTFSINPDRACSNENANLGLDSELALDVRTWLVRQWRVRPDESPPRHLAKTAGALFEEPRGRHPR